MEMQYKGWGQVAKDGPSLECDVYKQIEEIVSNAIIAKWSMLKLYNSESALHTHKPILHNDRCIANSSHLTCNDIQ